MVVEIVVSVVLLIVGIAVLVIIHFCIVGRVFRRGYNNGVLVVQRGAAIRSPSMSQEDIKKLPCFDYRKMEEEEEGNSPMDCAVCLEGFKDGELCRVLPNCKHSFHAHCIDSWLLTTAICPVCRACAAAASSNIGEPSSNSIEVETELV